MELPEVADIGCPGRIREVHPGGLVGVCLTCPLQGKPGKQLEPAAKRAPGGSFECENCPTREG